MPYFETEKFKLLKGNCLDLIPSIPKESIDVIFADPPYNLSNGGITCKAGKMVSVNKGGWDASNGFSKDFEFTSNWIKLCKDVLTPNGSIWISGTMHNIYQVGFALQSMGFHILNEITWFKPNAPPNLSCRYFTHTHETIIWAKKDKKMKHKFNYHEMKEWNDKISPSGKQMRSVWNIPLTPPSEKKNGKHTTQKPIELLYRIITSSSDEDDLVLDPFNGSGTTGIVANKLGRRYIGIDIDESFLEISMKRYKDLS